MPDWNIILSAVAYAALTGVFNLIFARKSQINAWCEANPRLAALFKVTRMVGLDPQHGWAALSLLVKKKLPAVQTEPPSEKDVPVRFGPLVVLVFVFAFSLTAGQACAPSVWQAQQRALNATVTVTNELTLPALRLANDLALLRAQQAPDEQKRGMALALATHRWSLVWKAYGAYVEAVKAWQVAIDSQGDVLTTALAARKALCQLDELARDAGAELPELPGGACR